MKSTSEPVLVLGAGINGSAIARELVLNRVPVVLVDTADIAFGTTAYSSRLVHGGLRYLEYGEFDLVRESLAERTRLLRLAPQFVHPLQLFIPVENRWGGFFTAAARFLRLPVKPSATPPARGLWLVRAGLWMYDKYARDRTLPKHAAHRLNAADAPPVDPRRYVALCSYFDAQIRFPERFTLALLEDARRVAAEEQIEFRVCNYHRAELSGRTVCLRRVDGNAATSGDERRFEPAAIVNATGAWVDETLARLGISSQQLIGGTRGSHFITSSQQLRELLGDKAIYAEAPDGRPVFVLPFGNATLVGTTDLPFQGDPATAEATPDELQYLLETVNAILPAARLTSADIDLHYCGVRPLPHVDASTPGAITRRHWIEEQPGSAPPLYSVIGGKLTTCRSLAEESVATILKRLNLPVTGSSRERLLPGAEAYPLEAAGRRREWERLGRKFRVPAATIERLAALVGTRLVPILSALADTGMPGESPVAFVAGTPIPRSFVAWLIAHEWVETLDDLVERRLLLHFDGEVAEAGLRDLADLLVAAGKLGGEQVDGAVEQCIARLHTHYGLKVQRLDQV